MKRLRKILAAIAATLFAVGCGGKTYVPGSPEFMELEGQVQAAAFGLHTAICLFDGSAPGVAAESQGLAAKLVEELEAGGPASLTIQDVVLAAVAAGTDDDTRIRIEGAVLSFEGFWQASIGKPLPGAGEEVDPWISELILVVLEVLEMPCPHVTNDF